MPEPVYAKSQDVSHLDYGDVELNTLLKGEKRREFSSGKIAEKRSWGVRSRARVFFALFALCSLFFFYHIRSSHSQAPLPFHLELGSLSDRSELAALLQKHAQGAKLRFESWQGRQSKDVAEARQQFQQRYGRSASPQFDEWVRFALEHNSVVIDDFDQVEANLRPFRQVPKDLMQRRIQALLDQKGHTGYIRVRNGIITVGGTGPQYQNDRMTDILKLLNGTTSLPDFVVPINWHDGPLQAATFPGSLLDPIESQHTFRKSKWDDMAARCDVSYIATSDTTSDRPTVDVCEQHRLSETNKDKHGFWVSQQGHMITPFPFLSWAKTSLNTDVIIPETCYALDEYRNRDDPDTTAFTQKAGSVFWRGSNTGLPGNDVTWMFGHRQRFILLSQRMNDAVRALRSRGFALATSKAAQYLLGPGNTKRIALQSLAHLTPDTFNASFTRMECEANSNACRTMEADIPLAKSSPRSTMFQHKYLFDIDGNGMSCRYYSLLESNSVTLKQTIYAEWHDERLVPWLHYVPVSMGMAELPALIDTFENTAVGQAIAADIAVRSKLWAFTALRNIDITIYYYRLLVGLGEILG